MTQQQDARQCCVEGCVREGIFWQEDGYDDDGEYRLCTVHQEAVNAEFDIAKARQKAWRDSCASLLAALEQARDALLEAGKALVEAEAPRDDEDEVVAAVNAIGEAIRVARGGSE